MYSVRFGYRLTDGTVILGDERPERFATPEAARDHARPIRRATGLLHLCYMVFCDPAAPCLKGEPIDG